MKQYTLLTNSGINKLLKTASDGSKIALKEVVVSDFEGELSEQTTSIPNEKYRGAINAITIDENDNNILDVDAIIPPEVGGFYIKTAGIYCDDGSLFAVARLADTYKPLLNEGSSKDITLNFKLQIANASESVILKVDNNVVLATRKWSENQFLKKTDKIDAYTKQESDSKFLKIGDYGLGGLDNMPVLQNIDDTTTPTGFYRAIENQTSGTFPQPYGGSRHAHVLVERVDINWIKQTIVQISQDGTKPIFYRTNNRERGWHPWKEVVTGTKDAAATANTIVQRDANGDFAGRFISADHFRLRTQQQNNLFHNGCDLLFRTSSADDQNYVRGVNANYAATMMGVIGIGQSWQNVTAQRAVNVTYTNTTGRPIQVFIQSHNLRQGGSFVINGISFQFAFTTDYYQAGQNVSFIVPAWNTYSVDLPFSMWLELR